MNINILNSNVNFKAAVFRDVMLCSLMGGYQCCGGTYASIFRVEVTIQYYINLDFP